MDCLFRIYTTVPIKSKDIQLAAPLNAKRFVHEGKMDAQLVRDFLNAMNLREAADYEAEFPQSGAEAVIASAEKSIEKAISIPGISEQFI
jgi:uncharacterized protein (UPF0332 family)